MNLRPKADREHSREIQPIPAGGEIQTDPILESLFDAEILQAARDNASSSWVDTDLLNAAVDQEIQRCDGDISRMWIFTESFDDQRIESPEKDPYAYASPEESLSATSPIFSKPTKDSPGPYLFPLRGMLCLFSNCWEPMVVYATQHQLCEHVRQHYLDNSIEKPRYKCPAQDCYTNRKSVHASFTNEASLVQHWVAFHFKLRFPECSLCGQRLATFGELDVHTIAYHRFTSFQCRLCAGSSFATKRELLDHARKHHPDHGPWICKYSSCGQIAYESDAALLQHMAEAHPDLHGATNDRRRTDAIYQDAPAPISSKKGHLLPLSANRRYPYPRSGLSCPYQDCPSEREVYNDKGQFLQHISRHRTSNGKYQCPVRNCGHRGTEIEFKDEFRFLYHWLRLHHKWTTRPDHKCQICQLLFESLEEMQAHVLKHRKWGSNYACWVAGCNPSWFWSLNAMEAHQQDVHPGCGYVICRHADCGHIACQNETTLIQHVLDQHSAEEGPPRPASVSSTQQTSPTWSARSFALTQTYCPRTKESSSPFLFSMRGLQCPFRDCRDHARWYTAERQVCEHISQNHRPTNGILKCPDSLCYTNRLSDESFVTELDLVQHWLRFHFNSEVLECPLCSRSFNTFGRLDVHVYSHHKLPYTCRSCNGSSFLMREDWTAHLTKFHSDIGRVVCPNPRCGRIAYESNEALHKHVIEGHPELFERPANHDTLNNEGPVEVVSDDFTAEVPENPWPGPDIDNTYSLDMSQSKNKQRGDSIDFFEQEMNSLWRELVQDDETLASDFLQFDGGYGDNTTLQSPSFHPQQQAVSSAVGQSRQEVTRRHPYTADASHVSTPPVPKGHARRTRKLPARGTDPGTGQQPRRTSTTDSTSSSDQTFGRTTHKRRRP